MKNGRNKISYKTMPERKLPPPNTNNNIKLTP